MKILMISLIALLGSTFAQAQSARGSSSIARLPKLSGHYIEVIPAPKFAAVEPMTSLIVKHRSCGRQNLKIQHKVARDVTYVKVVIPAPANDCPGPISTHKYRLYLPVGPYNSNVVVLNPIDVWVAPGR